MTTKSTYCSKSWTDININFESRTVQHCCKSVCYAFPEVLTEEFISKSENLIERKRLSLEAIAHSDCQSCWNEYSVGGTAYRDWNNRWSDDSIQECKLHEINDDRFVHHIEIKLDSTCDMSCIYCSPTDSSKIAEEEGVYIKDRTTENDYEIFKIWFTNLVSRKKMQDDYPKTIVVSFLGGEPTASKRFYEIVDHIEDVSKLYDGVIIKLAICTNANSKKFLMDKIINKMDNSRLDWEIAISNEAVCEDAEKIRYGLDWDRFSTNFQRYIQHPKVKLIILSPTITIFSLKSFHLYIKWVHEQFKLYSPIKTFTWVGNVALFNSGLSDIAYLSKDYLFYIELAEQEILKEKLNIHFFDITQFITFIDALKVRVGSLYNEDYKKIAQEFLEDKQKFKKTNILIKLMKNLNL